jgi:hypothetical protein
VRALRHYVAQDLLSPLEFRGTATRYARRELLRLLKLLEPKGQTRGSVVLTKLKRKLDTISDRDLGVDLGVATRAQVICHARGSPSPSWFRRHRWLGHCSM